MMMVMMMMLAVNGPQGLDREAHPPQQQHRALALQVLADVGPPGARRLHHRQPRAATPHRGDGRIIIVTISSSSSSHDSLAAGVQRGAGLPDRVAHVRVHELLPVAQRLPPHPPPHRRRQLVGPVPPLPGPGVMG
jgi:hypothetical protein